MPAKILIADDENYIRLLIQQTLEELEDEGVQLLTAGNGLQALDLIRLHHPQLVFLDVMMPGLSGFEVCAEVKHQLGFADIKIVMMTAKGQDADRQHALDAGADLYLTKPFDPDDLIQVARYQLFN